MTSQVSPEHEFHARDIFLTERELAARWRVSVKTLRNARALGTGCQYLKLGCVRYRLSDVLEYERGHMQRSTSERIEHV